MKRSATGKIQRYLLRQRAGAAPPRDSGTQRITVDIWLHEDFRTWNIEGCLAEIRCPILAIQGAEDEYGTFEQIDRIAARAADVGICKLSDCRHSPHRDQAQAVISATVSFVRQL